MKTYDLHAMHKILLETVVTRPGVSPETIYKRIFLEAIANKITLTEGTREIMSKLIDEVMTFFKNEAENNSRAMALLKIYNKVKPLGGFGDTLPALNKTLEMFSANPRGNDKLRDLVRYWLTNILTAYDGVSPFIAFGKEIVRLAEFLRKHKGNAGLQGENNLIDYLLSEHGIIPLLTKVASRLEDAVLSMKKDSSEEDSSANLEYDRFPRNLKPNMSSGDISDKFTHYQERGEPKLAFESVIANSLLEALATR
jgi:hypothetical protein